MGVIMRILVSERMSEQATRKYSRGLFMDPVTLHFFLFFYFFQVSIYISDT